MTLLLLAWDFDSSVVIGCVALAIASFMLNRERLSRFFVQMLGIIVLLIALESPIDALADSCLFSAHMLQHMLLVLIVPPLLVMGMASGGIASLLRTPILKRLERLLSNPIVAGVAGMGVLYAWHWPPWYDAALRDEWLHIAEHLSFLIGATIFWWPVLGPRQEQLMSPVVALLYLFIAMLLQSILGIVLTFVPVGTYRAYFQPARAPWAAGFSAASVGNYTRSRSANRRTFDVGIGRSGIFGRHVERPVPMVSNSRAAFSESTISHAAGA